VTRSEGPVTAENGVACIGRVALRPAETDVPPPAGRQILSPQACFADRTPSVLPERSQKCDLTLGVTEAILIRH